MPALDTEVLFAFDPRDKKHARVLKLLASAKGLSAPDVSLLEFQLVLRSRGRSPEERSEAISDVYTILSAHGVEEAKTIDSDLFALQCELESEYALTFFDSLIAASALSLDSSIVSDDEAFDSVPNLRRISLS